MSTETRVTRVTRITPDGCIRVRSTLTLSPRECTIIAPVIRVSPEGA